MGGYSLWGDGASTQRDIFDGMDQGQRALIVQAYDSVNIKRGLQYYAQAHWPNADPIASGTPRNIIMQTTSKPVIIKSRFVQYIGEEFTLQLYAMPQWTGGTPIGIVNYNLVSPVPTTVLAYKEPVVTNLGTPFPGGAEYYYGAVNTPNQNPVAIPPDSERIIPANSSFLVRIASTAGTGRFSYRLEWYEGEAEMFDG